VPVQLIHGRDEWRQTLEAARAGGLTVGLAPTMGSLHAGHLSLVRRARAECGFVAVTDYVNPLQFGDAADLVAYPRDLEADVALAASAGADAVFAPSADEMWPAAPATTVRVATTAGLLEDHCRPGHLDGMATIVTKLFALAGPARAYFGEKDYQQLLVVRRLAADLSLPIDVVGCPTVRDVDGLALSSRNAGLTEAERAVAPRLYWALLAGKRAIEEDGVTDPAAVTAAMSACLAAAERFTLEYAAAVDPDDLHVPVQLEADVRLLVAARLGTVRLIDNVGVTVPAALLGAASSSTSQEA
jgi:pantoate--beta-alanine ligase